MNSSGGRFAFGKNWNDYFQKHFSLERLKGAQKRLVQSLQVNSLEGLTVLDIGCGSGIHSLAALEAGAKRVVSFDYDIDSVTTSWKLRAWAGSPEQCALSPEIRTTG